MTKLHYLMMMKNQDNEALKEYRRSLKYFRKASLHNLNNDQHNINKKTFESLAAPILKNKQVNTSHEGSKIESLRDISISKQHPMLISELNDSSS